MGMFFDTTASVAVNAVDHNHLEVIEVIKSQAEKLMHTADMPNLQRVKLLEELSKVVLGEMKNNMRAVFVMSGGDAAGMSLKFARWFTKRAEIIAFKEGSTA